MIRNNYRDAKICTEEFKNKLVVITGATSGIGLVTAHKYASKGADLLCINRSVEKSEKLKNDIESAYKVECNYIIADLSSLEESFKVANELKALSEPIDVMIHNAGVFLTKRELTLEGFEKVLAIHYLSSFVINFTLMDKLKSQQKARIITGWAFTNPIMPAVSSMLGIAKSVLTPLPNIFQAGQWTYSPAGMPISILTGKLDSDRVVKNK